MWEEQGGVDVCHAFQMIEMPLLLENVMPMTELVHNKEQWGSSMDEGMVTRKGCFRAALPGLAYGLCCAIVCASLAQRLNRIGLLDTHLLSQRPVQYLGMIYHFTKITHPDLLTIASYNVILKSKYAGRIRTFV